MGKGQVQRPADHLVEQRPLARVTQRGDQPSAQDRGVEKGLDHAGAAQFLEHGGDVETGAAKAALILGEQRADDAQFRQFGPDRGAHPRIALEDLVAGLGGVLVGQIAPQRVLQHLPFFGQREIHVPQPPILTLAMIPRWISFEPPKIDSFLLLK